MKKQLIGAIALAAFLIIVALWYFLVKVPEDKANSVTSYETCIKAYPSDITTMQYPAKCTTPDGRTFVDTSVPVVTITPSSIGMANPASVYCEAQGGTLEIVDGEGGQVGMCTLESGKVCEEWAYYRGECK